MWNLILTLGIAQGGATIQVPPIYFPTFEACAAAGNQWLADSQRNKWNVVMASAICVKNK